MGSIKDTVTKTAFCLFNKLRNANNDTNDPPWENRMLLSVNTLCAWKTNNKPRRLHRNGRHSGQCPLLCDVLLCKRGTSVPRRLKEGD
jgi:hypothetical protein